MLKMSEFLDMFSRKRLGSLILEWTKVLNKCSLRLNSIPSANRSMLALPSLSVNSSVRKRARKQQNRRTSNTVGSIQDAAVC